MATAEAPTDEPAASTEADVQETGEPEGAQAPSRQDFVRQVNEALRSGDMPAALAALNQARLQLPEETDLAYSQLAMQSRYGNDLLEQGQTQAAADNFKSAAELAREVFADGAQVPDELKHLWQEALFNEARALASENQLDSALAVLQRAFDAGYEEFSSIMTDPFFAPIKDQPALAELIDKVSEQIRLRLREQARQELADSESFPFDFELPNLEDQPVKMADFKGKVLIVDIWGTWCPPCRMEIPHFVRLQETYRDELAIVGVNYEGGEKEESVKAITDFVAENGVNYPCVLGDEETQAKIPDFQGFPTTLLIDREGKVRLKLVGYHPYEKLEAYVTELMAEEAAATPADDTAG
jgi:thiol-disulfide isomerase/thioredoxin